VITWLIRAESAHLKRDISMATLRDNKCSIIVLTIFLFIL
jgi:hypothetical protein